MIFISFLTLVWICLGSSSPPPPPPHQIECTVVNLDYVNCTWDGDGTLSENYTFLSSYQYPDVSIECTSYQYIGALRRGCIIPYSEKELQRFRGFYSWLNKHNITIATQEYKELIKRVKLNAPSNMSVLLKDAELWVYWNITSNTKLNCQEQEVRYRINSKRWNIYSSVENAFNVAFPKTQSLYEFQVRVRMSSICGQSELWSDWSESVFWGSMKKNNGTEPGQQMPVVLMVLCTVGAAIILIVLTCLLIHSERIRVILVPVVPSPKNLGDLIDSYNGNVENWLHISKELQDGFKPNFSERSCTVREFSAHQQTDSDDCFSVHTADPSDSQSMQSFSSISTLQSHTHTPDAETTPLSML